LVFGVGVQDFPGALGVTETVMNTTLLKVGRSGFQGTGLVHRQVLGAAVIARGNAAAAANGSDMLQKQRARRPTSPHLAIYKRQLTAVMSALNRITGVALSGPLYLFAIAYLTQKLHGIPLDSATIASAFGSLPTGVKAVCKTLVALPFTFHSFNGVRHLFWDLGYGLSLKGVYATGYTVLGVSTATALALAFI